MNKPHVVAHLGPSFAHQNSYVEIDGERLTGVKSIKIESSVDDVTIVTIVLAALGGVDTDVIADEVRESLDDDRSATAQ